MRRLSSPMGLKIFLNLRRVTKLSKGVQIRAFSEHYHDMTKLIDIQVIWEPFKREQNRVLILSGVQRKSLSTFRRQL
jgi:hypothetical protein